MSFKKFISDVNSILVANVGVGYRDLEDFCWKDHFEDGASPIEAVHDFLEEGGYLRRYPSQFAPFLEQYIKAAG